VILINLQDWREPAGGSINFMTFQRVGDRYNKSTIADSIIHEFSKFTRTFSDLQLVAAAERSAGFNPEIAGDGN